MARTLNRSRNASTDTEEDNSGWGGFSKLKAEMPSKWEKTFTPSKTEEQPIKLLEDAPYDNYLQHWVGETPQGTAKSFICLGANKGCPLCAKGHVPAAFVAFNIANLSGDVPTNEVWKVGIGVATEIQDIAESKVGPLSNPDLYLAVTMKPVGKAKPRTRIRPITHVEEYFEVEPLSAEEIASLLEGVWDKSSTKRNTFEELEEIADTYL
jgi:hypothetical protein